MIGEPIYYRRNCKYSISRQWEGDLNLWKPFPKMEYDVLSDFAYLSKDGLLKIYFAFPSDGPSGPTWDDPTNLRTAFIHDALCKFIREGLLPESYRPYVDELLELIGIDDGMSCGRAELYHFGVVELSDGTYAKKGYEPYPEQVAPYGPIERPDYPKGE